MPLSTPNDFNELQGHFLPLLSNVNGLRSTHVPYTEKCLDCPLEQYPHILGVILSNIDGLRPSHLPSYRETERPNSCATAVAFHLASGGALDLPTLDHTLEFPNCHGAAGQPNLPLLDGFSIPRFVTARLLCSQQIAFVKHFLFSL